MSNADAHCRSRLYALLYLLFGALAVVVLSVILPPYQAPDEGTHFKRADQISRGVMLSYRIDTISGGHVGAGIGITEHEFIDIAFHVDVKATPDRYARAAPVTWANSGIAPASFPNTALYPPSLYLPQAVAIRIGKALALPVLDTLTLARIVTGMVSIMIGAVAIALSRGAAPLLFVLLSLPMTLFMMASVSQDGPLIAFAALAAGAFIGARECQSASLPLFLVMCVSAAFVAMGRPPYGALAVLPLLAFGRSWAARLLAVALILGSVALWTWIVSPLAPLALGPESNPTAQIEAMRAAPLRLLWIFARSINTDTFDMFIGRLGWLDTQLPFTYTVLASVVLLFGAVATAAGLGRGPTPMQASLIVAAVLAGLLVMLALSYITWSHPGVLVVLGIQGRYLTPFVLLIAAAIPGLAAVRLAPFVARHAFWVLVLFLPMSIAVTVFALMRRYYFSS
jgi:hypothetical protein